LKKKKLLELSVRKIVIANLSWYRISCSHKFRAMSIWRRRLWPF